jgi:pilus assembly protein Flp/PilA
MSESGSRGRWVSPANEGTVHTARTFRRTHSLRLHAEIEAPVFTSIIQRLRRLVRDERGPTAVEYAVMLALIIIVAMGSVSLLGASSKRVFQTGTKTFYQKTDGNQDGNGQY